MNKISVIILVNSPREIFHETLASVACFDEIVLVNNGPFELLKPFVEKIPKVTVYNKEFIGFGPLKQWALSKTSHDWILCIDSDEVLSQEAQDFLLHQKLSPSKVYSLPFRNYLYDKWIKACDWYPDEHIRVFNKTKAEISSDAVHEKILSKGLKTEVLKGYISHYSYEKIEDFLSKMQVYSTLYAKTKPRSQFFFFKAILSSLFTFFKSYFFQKGFFSAEGFIISVYKSHVAFYKYMKCWEKFNRLEK